MRIDPKQQIIEYGDTNNIKGCSNFSPITLKFKQYTINDIKEAKIITGIARIFNIMLIYNII